MAKQNFQQLFLQSSVSYEIILICWNISYYYQLKTFVLLNIFVETVMHILRLFNEYEIQKNCMYFKYKSFVTL